MGKLYVGNLPWSTTEDQLKDHFSKVGNVGAVRLVTDKTTGRSKGFAFVEIDNADKAIAEMDNTEFNGRPLRVNEARERELTPRQNYGDGYIPREGRGYNHREDRGYNHREDRGYNHREDRGYNHREDRGYNHREDRGYNHRDRSDY
jgi:RNA recognition motif-containing protein